MKRSWRNKLVRPAVPPSPARDSIPVTVLTGFLGSGKTTLLRRALTAPEFSDTAVVINEIGDIAIDHYLVDFVEGNVLELPGGCLCCAVREDLAQTLRSLIERRDAGEIRRFGRIVIETSGLADPAPILFTLGTDPMLDQRLRLARVVTLVDAVTGAATLDRFAEAARAEATHSHGIAAFAIVLEGAVSRLDFARALGGLAQARGNDLLRVKGIVRFADRASADGLGRPAIVQAAQHAMFAPEWLDDWPDEDRRSRLVFVVREIPRAEILEAFAFAGPVLWRSPS